jgi:large subunit ribosomal protein L32
MAVPKKRKSKAKTRSRRAQHDKIVAPTLGWCDNCGEPKQSHRVCLSCGTYRGRQLLLVRNY